MRKKIVKKNKNKENSIKKSNFKSSGNIFEDIGFSKKEAAAFKIKAEIYSEIMKFIQKKKIPNRQLEKIFDQPQPRISELINGKISKVSLEKLIEYLNKLGGQVRVDIKFGKAS